MLFLPELRTFLSEPSLISGILCSFNRVKKVSKSLKMCAKLCEIVVKFSVPPSVTFDLSLPFIKVMLMHLQFQSVRKTQKDLN